MSEKRWLSVLGLKDSFSNFEGNWNNSRNITAEDLQGMLDNDEPVPTAWYRRTDKGFEISETFDNVVHAARTIEYETNGKIDWGDLVCWVIESIATK
jgi:hypothetical protein